MTDQMSEAIIHLYGTDPKAAERVPHAIDAKKKFCSTGKTKFDYC